MGTPAQALELARVANDGMAELVARHPQRFAGFVASLPFNDPDAAVQEARARRGTLCSGPGDSRFSRT